MICGKADIYTYLDCGNRLDIFDANYHIINTICNIRYSSCSIRLMSNTCPLGFRI